MAHILVIDDERSIRNTLKEILEYEKFTVDLAEHGVEGLEKYQKGKLRYCPLRYQDAGDGWTGGTGKDL